MDLLRCKCSAWGDNHFTIPTAEVRALDGAIVLGRDPHISPVDVAGLYIHCHAVRPVAIGRNDLLVRAVGIQREDAASAQIEEE